ncbi:hypothetical protein LJC63_08110 [Ruminococcaceae bacterium OttesenSCG-928-L11]|nr:hypothetical protein [Ruminococcaceae bacterium OttesenSCG-928-L11]
MQRFQIELDDYTAGLYRIYADTVNRWVETVLADTLRLLSADLLEAMEERPEL